MDTDHAVNRRADHHQRRSLLGVEAIFASQILKFLAGGDWLCIIERERELIRERQFKPRGSTRSAPARVDFVASWLAGFKQPGSGFMPLREGADVFQPYFADMGGKADTQQLAQIIDRLAPLRLAQAKEHGARSGGGFDTKAALPLLLGRLLYAFDSILVDTQAC